MKDDPLDNRMGWIRNIEALHAGPVSEYTAEYEMASESYIPGILDYGNGAILCGPMALYKDSRGLYKYLLKTKYPQSVGAFPTIRAGKKGYLFPAGIHGELISIFSFFFQCRFFLTANYTNELTSTRLKLKTEYSPQIKMCKPYFDPDVFPGGERNFSTGLTEFLDVLNRIDAKYHQDLILGFYNYARALREFGIDEEMVFVRLVSSVEAFSEWLKLEKNDDPFSGFRFDDIIRSEKLLVAEKKGA